MELSGRTNVNSGHGITNEMKEEDGQDEEKARIIKETENKDETAYKNHKTLRSEPTKESLR